MTVHDLKTHPEPFAAVWDGRKTFEVRKNDRDFKVGDYLNLCEWDPVSRDYTGRAVGKHVTFILPGGRFGLPADLCVMAISPAAPEWTEDDEPLPEDAQIDEAFPTRSKRHDLYVEAMRLVGAKRSKGALVALVIWLLVEREKLRNWREAEAER